MEPSVRARLIAWWVAARWLVLVVAIVDSAARPSAPPTCWEILTMPEARPYSRSVSPVTERIVIGTKARPSPRESGATGPARRRGSCSGREAGRTRAGRRRAAACTQLVDAVMYAYVTWREKSVAVTAAYEDWTRAPRAKRLSAYAAYVTTLDAEERAASAYQRFVEQAAP